MCRWDSSWLMVVAQSSWAVLYRSCLWNARCALRCWSCMLASPPAAAGDLFSTVILVVVVVVTLCLRFPGKSISPGFIPRGQAFLGSRVYWGEFREGVVRSGDGGAESLGGQFDWLVSLPCGCGFIFACPGHGPVWTFTSDLHFRRSSSCRDRLWRRTSGGRRRVPGVQLLRRPPGLAGCRCVCRRCCRRSGRPGPP